MISINDKNKTGFKAKNVDSSEEIQKYLKEVKTVEGFGPKQKGSNVHIPIIGSYGSGKSNYASMLANQIHQFLNIPILRIQCEGAVLNYNDFKNMTILNECKTVKNRIGDNTYISLFPNPMTVKECEELIKAKHSGNIIVIDGATRLTSTEGRLMASGLDRDSMEFALLRIPYLADSTIVVMTINEDKVFNEVKGTAQGLIRPEGRESLQVIPRFNRRTVINSTWENGLLNFYSMGNSHKQNSNGYYS